MITENKKSWVIKVQEDPETGDGIIELPPELLEETGWVEGTRLVWTDMGNHSWSLSKAEENTIITNEVVNVVDEFSDEDGVRTASVYSTNNAGDVEYGVFLYRYSEMVEDRKCPGHNLRYAQDTAENWINKQGEFKV